MIPEELHLRNFLSHRATDLELRGVHLASLVGENGAGKSALLDAISWAVWGRSRAPYGHDEDLIYHGENSLEVEYVFRMPYQGGDEQRFRILRRREMRRRRSTTSILDFQVQGEAGWRPLNGNTIRETQARISAQLGLDYDTFTNSAYLRQGHADEFTVQPPAERKRVLGSILGLERWDVYRERVKQRLAEAQGQLAELERRLTEIEQELAHRPEIEADLTQAETEAQEAGMQRQEVQEQVNELTRLQEQAESLQRQLAELDTRRQQEHERLKEMRHDAEEHRRRRDAYQARIDQGDEIEARYRAHQQALDEERVWGEKLGQAANLQKEKARLEQAIAQARGALLQQLRDCEQRVAQLERAIAREGESLHERLQALAEQRTRAERAIERAAQELRNAIQAEEQTGAQLERALAEAKNRIEQEIGGVQGQIHQLERRLPGPELALKLKAAETRLAELKEVEKRTRQLRQEIQNAKVAHSRLIELNRHLKTQLEETKSRRETLAQAEANCPLCRQPLTAEHRTRLLEDIQAEEQRLDSDHRANRQRLREIKKHNAARQARLEELNLRLSERPQAERDLARLRQQQEQGEQAQEQIATFAAQVDAWQAQLAAEDYGAAERTALQQSRERLAALQKQLDTEGYAGEAREQLAQLQTESATLQARLAAQDYAATERAALTQAQQEIMALQAQLDAGEYAPEEHAALAGVLARLAELGYDAEAHAAVKEQVRALAAAEGDYRELEKSRVGVQGEIAALQRLAQEIAAQEQRLDALGAELQARQADRNALQPRLDAGPALLRALQEARRREVTAGRQVGALRQTLAALETQATRQKRLLQEQAKLATRVGLLKELREAFGVNGIPAMIIEHALPELEREANRVLERLAGGRMHVRFETQRETKAGKLRETLDIISSDEKGTRPYENFSGGEQFRINFAIRVALSRLLAQRSGVRLRSLFIDEGFGSLDADGRRRLVAAVKAVQDDFDLILVITHIVEMQDVFPTRIQVTKTDEGSQVEVL